MTIKHMPSGLFPHFDSALERRPFFVQEGDCVTIGCRLDDSHATSMHMVVLDKRGKQIIPGTPHSVNDRGQRYFHFSYQTKCGDTSFNYYFITSDQERSKEYYCPVLRELTLIPQVKEEENLTYLVYGTDTQEYRIQIFKEPCIRVIFTQCITVKIDRKFDKYKLINDYAQEAYEIEADNRVVLKLKPQLKIMVDHMGRAHNLRVCLAFPGSAVFGCGEKFDAVNQIGKQPLNYVVEQFANQQDKTYLPIPFLFTDGGVSFLQKTSAPSSFCFSNQSQSGWISMELFAVCPEHEVLYDAVIHTGKPEQLLKAYHMDSGRAVLPPKWAFGPWMSSNGWNTQLEALEQIYKMEETAIPATVMVLEAWSDEETFYIWNDAQYTPRKDGSLFQYRDFTFPEDGKWPNPKEFCKTLQDKGVKLVLWNIPVIKYEEAPHGEQLDLDWAYAKENGLCLKNADGTPYQITEMWFGNSLIPDFTNPKTKKWWFNCRKYLIDELGVAGFKTDGGEFLFDPDAYFYNGKKVSEAHNLFPNLYASTYHELLEPQGGVTFSRAGFTGAQQYPLHWAGDQLSTFEELKGQLKAGLSLGLSGVPFWGFDIGGFAGDFPTTELYLRSAAFGAFAPVMQFHSEPRGGQYYMVARNHWNNDRSPWNMAIVNDDASIIEIYRMFANLRMNLLPYIWREAEHCCKSSRPMMAHLVYDYPEDKTVLCIEDEYLFGRSLLVAPVVTEGAADRMVYLPEGSWIDFWSGQKYAGEEHVWCACPLNRIPLFVQEGSALPVNMNKQFCMGTKRVEGAVGNRIDGYENLCFLLFGAQGRECFSDAQGNDLEISWDQNGEAVRGSATCAVTVFRMDGCDHGSVCGDILERKIRGIRREPE